MLKMNSISLNGASSVESKEAVFFSANIPSVGNPTISKSISNRELYLEHKTECEADYDEFETQAISYINEEN